MPEQGQDIQPISIYGGGKQLTGFLKPAWVTESRTSLEPDLLKK